MVKKTTANKENKQNTSNYSNVAVAIIATIYYLIYFITLFNNPPVIISNNRRLDKFGIKEFILCN
jgi:cell division protein FtsN